MFITICAGNTSTYLGFFEDGEPIIKRLPTRPFKTVEEYRKAIDGAIEEFGLPSPEAGVLTSVVPAITNPLKDALARASGGGPVLVVSHRTVPEMKFAVKSPELVGADRISASYGAWKLYGGPVAVVDMGTATTINFVTADGTFLGGAILPGLILMRDSLKERTAKLPRVELSKPGKPLGKDTEESILAGLVYGTSGAIGRIVEEAELERLESFKIALTGGYGDVIAPYLKRLDYREPALVLKGMAMIYKDSPKDAQT